MERTEKIDAIVEFLDENHIKIIDSECIGSVIVDAEVTLNKENNQYECEELLEKGLTDSDIESFNKFLEKRSLMMIKSDEISGVSFENSEINFEELNKRDLWNDKIESMNIEIRSVSTEDVKIAQRALETIGFKTINEGDAVDAYWVKLMVPEKFAHGDCIVKLGIGSEEKEVCLKW